DLTHVLELLIGVRNWANRLDIDDAVNQERAFYARQTDDRPPAASRNLLSKREKEELRSRVEVAIEAAGGPLPTDDAGLIEAERRLRALRAEDAALRRDFAPPTREIEDEILESLDAALSRLEGFIH